MIFAETSMADLVVSFSINSLNFALPTMTTIPMLVKYNIEEKEYAKGTTLITLAMSLVILPMLHMLLCNIGKVNFKCH